MKKKYLFLSLCLISFSVEVLFSKEVEFKEMTLKDFMEDYVEIAEKKFKKGNKEPLKKMLEAIPDLALTEDTEKWEIITTEFLESGKYLSSCKSCHVKFKKIYKKTYRKRFVKIPKEVLNIK